MLYAIVVLAGISLVAALAGVHHYGTLMAERAELKIIADSAERLREARADEAKRASEERKAREVAQEGRRAAEEKGRRLAQDIRDHASEAQRARERAAAAEVRAAMAEGREVNMCPKSCYVLGPGEDHGS